MKKIAPVLITLTLLLLIIPSVYGQDLNEPNNELGDSTGITFNQSVSGYIYPARDVDCYKFNVTSSGILQVKIENVPSDMRPKIDLYGKNFNWITSKQATNAGDTITLEIDIVNPQWYYIKIWDIDGKAHNTEYSFTVTFEPVVDLNEPNGEIGDSTLVEFNQSVSGYIYPARDVDFYKFYPGVTGPVAMIIPITSGILQVKIDNVPSDMKPKIDLYGKNFNWITSKQATNAGDTITLEIDIANPRWYSQWHYIKISDLNGKAHNTEYSFTVSFEPVTYRVPGNNEIEPNSEIGDSNWIDFNQSVRGYIYPARDVDFYKFNVTSPGILQVKIENVSSDMRPKIDLYGKNFNWITSKQATNVGDTITLEIDIANPQWYYIKILDLDGKAHNTEYSFTVTFEPVVDLNEPNGEIGDSTLVEFNQSVGGYIYPARDEDFYKFNVTSPGILQVKIDNVPSDMRPRIDLYGKNFNWITSKQATNAGDTITLEIDIANPQWYYIKILDLDGKAHNTEYSFKVI